MFAICITPKRTWLLYNERRVPEVNEARLRDWVAEHYARPWPQRLALSEQAAHALCEYLRQFA